MNDAHNFWTVACLMPTNVLNSTEFVLEFLILKDKNLCCKMRSAMIPHPPPLPPFSVRLTDHHFPTTTKKKTQH